MSCRSEPNGNLDRLQGTVLSRVLSQGEVMNIKRVSGSSGLTSLPDIHTIHPKYGSSYSDPRISDILRHSRYDFIAIPGRIAGEPRALTRKRGMLHLHQKYGVRSRADRLQGCGVHLSPFMKHQPRIHIHVCHAQRRNNVGKRPKPRTPYEVAPQPREQCINWTLLA